MTLIVARGKSLIETSLESGLKEKNDDESLDKIALTPVSVMDSENIRPCTVGRRKNGQQKNVKEKKTDEDGNEYNRDRGRRGSQGNGSSEMEGSGSGNGDESSDDDEDDDEEDEDDEDDEEDEDEDTDNVSTIVEDDMEETTNGSSTLDVQQLEFKTLEFENPGPKVEKGESGETTSPAVSGTPITLSGVIWKETVGGVLVVNLKYRNKMYCGSLIDHSRHGWATPRNLDEPTELTMSTSKRGKGRKGRHNGSAYTGNPLSPKMTGNSKRGPRFHRNKGKHGKDSFVRPRSKRGLGSDNTEEGTRTRRRSCTVKTTSPSPSPTPLIECPEANCNKKYKHINGLRYHQAHAHLDNIDKDSDEDEEAKSNDIKEPLSKSSSSDDVKPLSRRKAKNPKTSNKSSDNVSVEDFLENDQKETQDVELNMTNIKIEEPDEPVKLEEKPVSSSPNILQEAVKMIFDEPNVSDSQITCSNDVTHSGIFARMISQHMMTSSHSEDYKYVTYEPMPDSINAHTEKTGIEDMDITVKEEVIEEGNAGMGKMSCKNQTEDDNIKLVNTETNFEIEKEGNIENILPEIDKTKFMTEKQAKSGSHANRKSVVTDTLVTKETNQMKTSAAEIRSLPGYQHFRLSSNSSGYIAQSPEEKTCQAFDARPFEAKEPEKSVSGIIWDSGGTLKQQGTFDKQKSRVWKLPSTSSFQLTCESNNSLIRSGYSVSSSKKPSARSVVTASTTWVPEVHPAVLQKTGGASVPGQEVVPEKPLVSRDIGTSERDEEKTKPELSKCDDDRTKASYLGKPARAVGVAHPFNTEKTEDEFALGSIGSFSSEPVKVLYSKSSSPKVSVDLNELTEVKKVRVEKTLAVPVGEVIPLAKTNRSAVNDIRQAVIVGGEGTENYSAIRAPLQDNRQTGDSDSAQRDGHPSYIPAVTERPLPWQPSYSPPMAPRDSRQYQSRETTRSPLRKTGRRSPIRELDIRSSSSLRATPGGYTGMNTGRRTPEEDPTKRLFQRDKILPFGHFDERSLPHRDKGLPLRNIGRSTPEKDPPARVPPRGAVETYRDSDRLSPGGDKNNVSQFREYDRSPLGDSSQDEQRSPLRNRLQRSPEREIVARASSYRATSPSNRESIVQSPYRDQSRVKQPRDSDETTTRSGENSDARGYSTKSRTIKDTTEGTNTQRMSGDNKQFPRLSEEEAMMLNLRSRFFSYPTPPQDSATREAMENYMMYYGRLPFRPTLDPRLLQAYSMLPASQIPLLMQPPKDNTVNKEDRMKEGSDETRSKSGSSKSETPRNRGTPFSESSDLEIVTSKRLLTSKEKNEYESTPSKRTKPSEQKDVHEILDEGSKMPYRKLEERVYDQALQHKMDALAQLQNEKNLKQKAEEKSNRQKSSSSSRQKSAIEYRTTSKKEESLFSGSRCDKDIKSREARLSPATQSREARLSPATRPNDSGQSWIRNTESPQSGVVYPGFPPHLPANHALSNSYEQATRAMQGMPPFIMPPYHLPPGIMMTNPLVAGAQFHSASRGHDATKRDHSRSSSTTTSDQSRTKDDDHDRDYSSQTKKDVKTNSSNSPTSKSDVDKERGRSRKTTGDDEEKQRIMRDNHGSQNLPSNLAFGRGNMSAIDQPHFNQAFPHMMYPPVSGQGNYRPPFEHPYNPYQRK